LKLLDNKLRIRKCHAVGPEELCLKDAPANPMSSDANPYALERREASTSELASSPFSVIRGVSPPDRPASPMSIFLRWACSGLRIIAFQSKNPSKDALEETRTL